MKVTKKIIKNIWYCKIKVIVLLALIFEFTCPHFSLAAETIEPQQSILLPNMIIKADLEAEEKVYLIMPIYEPRVAKTYNLIVTAYSSTPDQTDSTPCITANGFDLCAHNQEDVVAANFLPFGTKIKIPEYFGDRIFTVQDRMNDRYYYRVDVWLESFQAAKSFGAHYTVIEVLE